MGMQDVPTPQCLDLKDELEIEIRLRKIAETSLKFKEKQQASKVMYRIILSNRSECSQKDSYAIKQMIAPKLYIMKNLMMNLIAHI